MLSRHILPLLLTALVSTGCVTLRDTSPFGDTPLTEDRVNVWPLYYASSGVHSILWPIIEFGPESLAVRPLFETRPEGLDLLWPLLRFQEDGGGRVLPFVMWSGDGDRIVVPIFLSGVDGENDLLVTPLWIQSPDVFVIPPLLTAWSSPEGWTPESEDKKYFASPLFYRGSSQGKTQTAIPVLLSGYESGPDAYELNLLASIYRQSRDGEAFHNRLFPIYDYERNESTRAFSLLELPFSHDYEPLTGTGLGVSLAGFRFGEDESSHTIFPFYRSIDRPGLESRQIALLYGWTETEEASSNWLLPFFWRNDFADRETLVLPLLLSGVQEERDPESSDVTARSTHVLLSLIAWGHENDERFSRFVPFYFHREGPESHAFGIPLLLTGFVKKPNYELVSWPLAIYGRERIDDPEDDSYRETRSIGYLFRAFESNTTSGHTLFPIYNAKTTRPPVDDAEEDPVIEKSELEVLGFVYRFDRETRQSSETRRDRFLWKVWQHDYDGDRRSIDAFPFYSFESSESEDHYEWSWLWRFLHYERNGEDRDFTFCFIPFF